VDSEHSGIFQCLAKEKNEDVARAILTASGGPFLRTRSTSWDGKRPKRPWPPPVEDGAESDHRLATLMNKGLELIEARWLFGLEPPGGYPHPPQSIVHSLVEMKDGSSSPS